MHAALWLFKGCHRKIWKVQFQITLARLRCFQNKCSLTHWQLFQTSHQCVRYTCYTYTIQYSPITIHILSSRHVTFFFGGGGGGSTAIFAWICPNPKAMSKSIFIAASPGTHMPGNNFPGIASQFAMHFLYDCYTRYLLRSSFSS